MSSVKDKIKGAKRPQKTVNLCLRGDLQADHERLEAELERLITAPASDRLNDPTVAQRRQVAEQIQALAAQMADDTVTVTVRGMPGNRWDTFRGQHPARPGVKEDEPLGVNLRTFIPALLRTATIDPELDDDDWDQFLGNDDKGVDSILTSRQIGDWYLAALLVNRGEVDVPFSLIASAVLQPSSAE